VLTKKQNYSTNPIMREILVIGSGKSSSYLIKYLLDKSEEEDLYIIVGDIDLRNAQKLINDHEHGHAITLDVFNHQSRKQAIENADIVVSMLPARYHIEVARDCITLGKNLVTASYVSKEMEDLNTAAINKGLVFMNEIGVDPGIDHMSAMKVIDKI